MGHLIPGDRLVLASVYRPRRGRIIIQSTPFAPPLSDADADANVDASADSNADTDVNDAKAALMLMLIPVLMPC